MDLVVDEPGDVGRGGGGGGMLTGPRYPGERVRSRPSTKVARRRRRAAHKGEIVVAAVVAAVVGSSRRRGVVVAGAGAATGRGVGSDGLQLRSQFSGAAGSY